jgi:hypothetical protein
MWTAILTAGPNALTHDMWCAVIRAVATAVVSGQRSAGVPSEYSVEDDVECLIAEWQNESVPSSATISRALFDFEYFYDLSMAWDEKIALAGEACGYASDAVWDLHGRYWGYAEVKEAITEESVKDFYTAWRTEFLNRVLNEARGLNLAEGT